MIQNTEKSPKIKKVKNFDHNKLVYILISRSLKLQRKQWATTLKKTFAWFKIILRFETLFGQNRGFPRKIPRESRDFPKSRWVREVVSPSLVIGLGCPDTLGVPTDSNSLIYVVCNRLRPAQTIAILSAKIDFGEKSHSPPHWVFTSLFHRYWSRRFENRIDIRTDCEFQKPACLM